MLRSPDRKSRMPHRFETWLRAQNPDLLARDMGLPPLGETGRAFLQDGLDLTAAVATASIDYSAAQAALDDAVASFLDAKTDAEIIDVATSVNIERGYWATDTGVIEDSNLRRLVAAFVKRLGANVISTAFALRSAKRSTAVPLIADDFIGDLHATIDPPDAPGVSIEISPVVVQPRGASSIEGAFVVNGQVVPWVFAAPFPVLRSSFTSIRNAVARTNSDPGVAQAVHDWATRQAELLAFEARAELVTVSLAA